MNVPLFAAAPCLQPCVERWAAQFHLPQIINSTSTTWILRVTASHVELVDTTKKFTPIWIDFLQGKLGLRAVKARPRNELIARAVGVNQQYKPIVWDVTAGWGQDAFLLMMLGCRVTMIERSPVMAVLLQDALDRFFSTQPTVSPGDFSLIFGDAQTYLEDCLELPDVIYLDPMYPMRVKSSLVKKEMQILQEIISEQAESSLLSLALTKVKNRVVVKRPLRGVFLEGKQPDFQCCGKTTRFDVYLRKNIVVSASEELY